MEVSIGDLCKRLGVQEVSPSVFRETSQEWFGRASTEAKRFYEEGSRILIRCDVPYAEQARLFDGHALVPTQKIAPVVCEKLAGIDSVLELGFGTGFRLLYYALNWPNTKFLGIDSDEATLEVAKKRITALGVQNVEVRKADIFDLKLEEKFGSVLALDCWPKKALAETKVAFSLENLAHFERMVDPAQRGAFITACYGKWTFRQIEAFQEVGRQTGLYSLKVVRCDYQKPEDPLREAVVIIASK